MMLSEKRRRMRGQAGMPFAARGRGLSVASGFMLLLLLPAALSILTGLLASSPLHAQQRTALYDELKDFVTLDYLGTGTDNHITSPTLFAPQIDYYGKRNVPREAMMRDRLAYYDRWPIRSYLMLQDTFRIAERDADTVDVSFDYRFEVAGDKRRAGGIGRTDLTIRLDADGGFTITREGGKVIERF